jgi:hypothetical protein
MQRQLKKAQARWMADVSRAYAKACWNGDYLEKCRDFARQLRDMGYFVAKTETGCWIYPKGTKARVIKTRKINARHAAQMLHLMGSGSMRRSIGTDICWNGVTP